MSSKILKYIMYIDLTFIFAENLTNLTNNMKKVIYQQLHFDLLLWLSTLFSSLQISHSS